jgi:hypothetical protein
MQYFELYLVFGFRASLLGKSAGQVCRASLLGKSAGQVCRASLPGKAAVQVCRARLPGKVTCMQWHNMLSS